MHWKFFTSQATPSGIVPQHAQGKLKQQGHLSLSLPDNEQGLSTWVCRGEVGQGSPLKGHTGRAGPRVNSLMPTSLARPPTLRDPSVGSYLQQPQSSAQPLLFSREGKGVSPGSPVEFTFLLGQPRPSGQWAFLVLPGHCPSSQRPLWIHGLALFFGP